MTRRITITLPDEIAERLDIEPNASAFVARAITEFTRTERTWDMLRQAGYIPTPESRARARKKIDDARARATPESRARADQMLQDLGVARADRSGS